MTRERPGADAPLTEEERLLEQLSALLDGELDADERAEAEALIASDDDAREAFEDLRLIRTTLASLDPVPAPRSFALAAPAAPVRRGLLARFDFVLRIGSAAAALLFVFALAGGGSLQTASVPARDAAENTASISAAAGQSESLGTLAESDGDSPSAPANGPSGAAPLPDEQPGVPPSDTAGGAGGAATDTPAFVPGEEEAFRAGDAGPAAQASEEIGGVAASLGALALLLAALSGLFTWQRRAR